MVFFVRSDYFDEMLRVYREVYLVLVQVFVGNRLELNRIDE